MFQLHGHFPPFFPWIPSELRWFLWHDVSLLGSKQRGKCLGCWGAKPWNGWFFGISCFELETWEADHYHGVSGICCICFWNIPECSFFFKTSWVTPPWLSWWKICIHKRCRLRDVTHQEFGDNMKILGEGFRKATLQTEYEKAPGEFPQGFFRCIFEAKFPVDFETFDVKMELAFVINEARLFV